MYHKLLWLFLVSIGLKIVFGDPGFVYNGFQDAHLSLDGVAEITGYGLLRLTNDTKQEKGHAFYPNPFIFKTRSNGTVVSFSSTFVFAIVPEDRDISGHGIVFLLSPSKALSGALPSQYLGLFSETSNGDASNHVVAVELDTILSTEFSDINDNHVGIDINDLTSVQSAPAMYYDDTSARYKSLSLISGKRMQVWIEYDGLAKSLDVTIAPFYAPKPQTPLLSCAYDISPVILDSMYVGFSSSTGSVLTSHFVLGWSFQVNGLARPLDLKRLPQLPQPKGHWMWKIALPAIVAVFVLASISCIFLVKRRKRKYAEVFENWELNYGAHRFSYKELYIATNGFKESELLGIGGFGRVYKGVLTKLKTEVAVKKVSHESRESIKEFIAEIVSIGQLRHRNLVQLLGYCRRQGELLLVYDYMPNGSLDKFLFYPLHPRLNWSQRLQIIKGVTSGLVYLHEEWEQVVVHRDIKASNVLIDGELNGRLGDFGLARLYDHGTNPQTTHVVGTLGYLAPEITTTGKVTTSTDVYAFGAFLLEVACGRRPIEPLAEDEKLVLVNWVTSSWSRGTILETVDPNMGSEYVKEEVELVLKIGLLCTRTIPRARPSMRQVVQFLNYDSPIPDLFSLGFSNRHGEEFDDFTMSYCSSLQVTSARSSSAEESVLSAGR